MIHNILNITAAKSYVPYQELENKQMLLGLLDDPGSFVNHVRRYTNSLSTQMVFGFRTTDIRDPKLEALFHVSRVEFVWLEIQLAKTSNRDLSSSVKQLAQEPPHSSISSRSLGLSPIFSFLYGSTRRNSMRRRGSCMWVIG
jgi:hypothetical protein